MNKTVGSVIEDINEWPGPHGTVYFVTCMFTDETVGSVGRKDHDAALEVQGLLRESIGKEMDFTLEAKGQTKTGRDKFKILGFGIPGGAETYTAPGVQGGGASSSSGGGSAGRGRSPEHDADIARAVALKAAVELPFIGGTADVLRAADEFYAWLRTSEPASSAYPSDNPVVTSTPAGVGSEEPSAVAAAEDGGQVGEGEASACPPHDLNLDVEPRAMRFPCRRCGAWVKPSMAADEAEEAAKT